MIEKFFCAENEFGQILKQLSAVSRPSGRWAVEYIIDGKVIACHTIGQRYGHNCWIDKRLVQRQFDFVRSRPLNHTEAHILNNRFFDDKDHDVHLLPETERWYTEYKQLNGKPKQRLSKYSVNFRYLETTFPTKVRPFSEYVE